MSAQSARSCGAAAREGEITAPDAIDGLPGEEYATRKRRRTDVALRTARLVPVKTLEGVDFSFQPALDRERIAALAQLDFIHRAGIVHCPGPPGTGKSYLATAAAAPPQRPAKASPAPPWPI